jgi:PadR family transcriptional regulator PadR
MHLFPMHKKQMHNAFVYVCTMYSKELLKGTLKTIILKMLSESDSMYGYQITQKVKEITEGKINLTEGALYPALHKLEADGFLTTEKQTVGNRVRKYYSLTQAGNSSAKEKIEELKEFMETLKTIVNLTPQNLAWSI